MGPVVSLRFNLLTNRLGHLRQFAQKASFINIRSRWITFQVPNWYQQCYSVYSNLFCGNCLSWQYLRVDWQRAHSSGVSNLEHSTFAVMIKQDRRWIILWSWAKLSADSVISWEMHLHQTVRWSWGHVSVICREKMNLLLYTKLLILSAICTQTEAETNIAGMCGVWEISITLMKLVVWLWIYIFPVFREFIHSNHMHLMSIRTFIWVDWLIFFWLYVLFLVNKK